MKHQGVGKEVLWADVDLGPLHGAQQRLQDLNFLDPLEHWTPDEINLKNMSANKRRTKVRVKLDANGGVS